MDVGREDDNLWSLECIFCKSLHNTGLFAHLRLHSRIYTRNILEFSALDQILLPLSILFNLLPDVLTFDREYRQISIDGGVAQKLLGDLNCVSPQREGGCFQLHLLWLAASPYNFQGHAFPALFLLIAQSFSLNFASSLHDLDPYGLFVIECKTFQILAELVFIHLHMLICPLFC